MKVTNLAQVLYASGRTQQDIARAAGISPHCLSQLALGRRHPRLKTALALSRALGEPVEKLMQEGGAS